MKQSRRTGGALPPPLQGQFNEWKDGCSGGGSAIDQESRGKGPWAAS